MFIYLYGFKLLLCLVKKIQMSCQCFYVFILHGSIFIKEKKKSRCAQIHNASQVAVILYFFSMETLMPKLRVHQEIVFKLATSMSMNI